MGRHARKSTKRGLGKESRNILLFWLFLGTARLCGVATALDCQASWLGGVRAVCALWWKGVAAKTAAGSAAPHRRPSPQPECAHRGRRPRQQRCAALAATQALGARRDPRQRFLCYPPQGRRARLCHGAIPLARCECRSLHQETQRLCCWRCCRHHCSSFVRGVLSCCYYCNGKTKQNKTKQQCQSSHHTDNCATRVGRNGPEVAR